MCHGKASSACNNLNGSPWMLSVGVKLARSWCTREAMGFLQFLLLCCNAGDIMLQGSLAGATI
jgi:hypothetical protein